MNTKNANRNAEVKAHMIRLAKDQYGFTSVWGRFHVELLTEHGESFYELTEFDTTGKLGTFSLDTWDDVLEFLATYL